MKTRTLLLLSFLIIVGQDAVAKNVDLVTLPRRDTVQLTIYNSEDITLAKETRYITFKKGWNKLQFSWAHTLIDPTSVELRPLAHADKIEVADTVFSGQKPQHLIWNVRSQIEGQVPVEVSYFTSGLTWQMDYVAITDPEEEELAFRGHVRVLNNSGEEYEDAEIRLIVGKINLVEKIADLARQRGIQIPATDMDDSVVDRLRSEALGRAFNEAEKAKNGPGSGPRQIVKEGLSEYFMFSVAGTETIRNGWSKRMRAVKADEVTFDIVYRMRSYQYGPRPVRFFIWRNDEEHHLGESPLPNGLVRVFRDNGREGLSFLGQQSLNYVPVKAEIEVNLGPDDLVVYERRKTKTERLNFHFDRHTRVDGWDERQAWVDRVRNYREKPIHFELRLQFSGDVDFESDQKTSAFDYRTIETKFDVLARDKHEYAYVATTHHGTNAKQNRVKIKKPL